MVRPPNILTIAGSDSGGGAGIQADIKTIMAMGCYGMSVVCAVTAQNGKGVAGIEAISPEFVAMQMQTVLDGFPIAAAKTGMLFSAPIISALAPFIQKRNFSLVVDPVCASQSGSPLLEQNALDAMLEYLIPGCDLLTPNIPEATLLTGFPIENMDDAIAAGEELLRLGAKAVLVKGGHMPGSVMVEDCLCLPGRQAKKLAQARIETNNNHGTGCTLSAAIASGLGQGMPVEVAIVRAQKFINAALRKSYAPGIGCGPVNHAACLQSAL